MENHDVTGLIPQRHPFVMIDRLVYADEKRLESSLHISEDNILTENGVFSEAGLIENIAQSAAMHAGYMAAGKKEKTPGGMIGGVKNLAIQRLPQSGNKIKTEIIIEHEIMNAKVIRGIVSIEEKVIAECEMKVFLL